MLGTHADLSLQPLCSRTSQSLNLPFQCSVGQIYNEGGGQGTLRILHSYYPWEWSQAV